MAKRDFFYDTKTGRALLGGQTVFLLIVAVVLVVLCISRLVNPQGTGNTGRALFWLILGLIMIFSAIMGLIILKRRKPQAPEGTDTTGEAAPETSGTKPKSAPEPSAVPMVGEPDDVVVLDPTRPNEPDGAILVYRKEGVLVFDGKQIPIGKIVEGYVSNSNNNPYLPVAYHILLVMDDKNIVHIPVGQDFEWAQEALKQLQAAIAPQG